MDPIQIGLIGLAVFFGSAVQGAVGFGAGLFAIPLMVWAGTGLPSAIMITLMSVAVQSGWNLYRYHGQVAARELMPLFFLRIAMLPVGVMLLGVLVGMGRARVKQAIGLMLLVTLGIKWLLKVKPRESVARGWTVLAGASSGLCAGLVGMGGPPVVLWVMAHNWPAKKSRSFLWATFILLVPFNTAWLLYQFPDALWGSLLLGLCLAPVVLVAAEVGQRAGGLMNRQRLQQAALGLLLLLAAASILEPIFSG